MSLGLLVFLSLMLGVAAWLFFVWTVKSGQYDDPEGPKYRMLEDDEDARTPAEVKPRDAKPPERQGAKPPERQGAKPGERQDAKPGDKP
ncbi:MAG TPA: cbb3-type cytochrome oxidase assembly protein CcoS [Anaeromyxobacter sp.]